MVTKAGPGCSKANRSNDLTQNKAHMLANEACALLIGGDKVYLVSGTKMTTRRTKSQSSHFLSLDCYRFMMSTFDILE